MRKSLVIMLAMTCIIPALSETPSSPGFVSMGVSYQSWKIQGLDFPIQQTTIPIMVFVPVSPGFYVSLSNTPGFSKYNQTKLNGLSDTYLRGTYVLPGERFMFNLGLGTPTGKTELTVAEFGLSRSLSETAFRFRLPLYGQGFHAKLGAALAYPTGENTVLGCGLNYVIKTAYNPTSDTTYFSKFRPGNETSLFVGIDVKFAERSKWNFDIAYSFYGEDKVLSSNEWMTMYNSGNRLLINTSLVYGFDGGFVTGNLHWRQKGKNETWVADGASYTWGKRKNGNQLEMELLTQLGKAETLQYRFAIEGRIYGKNDDQRTGGASILGLGAGLSYPISPTVSIGMDLRYLTGKGDIQPFTDVKINGFDVMTGLAYRF